MSVSPKPASPKSRRSPSPAAVPMQSGKALWGKLRTDVLSSGGPRRPKMVAYVFALGWLFSNSPRACYCFPSCAFRSVTDDSIKRKALANVVTIFRQPESKRTEEQLRAAARFMFRHQFSLKFFRNKSRARIESLCRVMGAIVCRPGAAIFEQGVRARFANMYACSFWPLLKTVPTRRISPRMSSL